MSCQNLPWRRVRSDRSVVWGTALWYSRSARPTTRMLSAYSSQTQAGIKAKTNITEHPGQFHPKNNMVTDSICQEHTSKYLQSVGAEILSIHFLNGFTNTCNIRVLNKCILGNAIHPLDINILKSIKTNTCFKKRLQQLQGATKKLQIRLEFVHSLEPQWTTFDFFPPLKQIEMSM